MRSPIFNPKNIALSVAGLALTALTAIDAHAQIPVTAGSLTYTQNFNTLDTASATSSSNLPTGWEIYESGTSATVNNQYKGNTGASNSGDVYSYGSALNTERALGSLGSGTAKQYYGARFVNNTGATITSIAITYQGEQWRRGTATNDTLLFRYSTTAANIADTAAAQWTENGALTLNTIYNGTPSDVAINGNGAGNFTSKTGTLTVNIPNGGSFLMEWVDKNVAGTDDGLSVDDLSVTFTTGTPPVATNIYILNKTPQGNGTPLSANALTVKFDNPIAAGTGQVQLFKSGSSTAVSTFTVPSASVTISDSTATLSGITLENNTRYYVHMAAGSFTKTGGTLPCLAINDTTTWWFKTVDTTTAPPPTPLTSLNETFAGCINSAMGVFVQYSVAGNKTWRCSSLNYHGSSDTSSVYINGGSAAGVSESNEDWLISKAPFNFSAMSAPELSLWQYRHFEGAATRTVKVSTNYVAGANPNTATWTTLSVPAMGNTPALDTWEQISGIDLTPYKATPFYLAFTYTCGTTGAYELTYDDIVVANKTLGIFSPNRGKLALQVLGDATASAINLGITLDKAGELGVQIFDLTGRRVHHENIKVNSGKSVYTITNTNLQSGMYVIRVSNGADYGTIKAVVK